MRIVLRFSTMVAYIIVGHYSVAQNIRLTFDRISIDQGLSQSTVYCALQDRLGFFWFGTLDGLNRYDGYQFTVFRHRPFDESSLSDNFVYCGLSDAKGDLWFGTDGGLNRYVPETSRFERFLHQALDTNSISDNRVHALWQDVIDSSVIWIGTENGLNKFDHRTQEQTVFSFQRFMPDDFINSIVQEKNGRLWIATKRGLFRMDFKTKAIEPFLQTISVRSLCLQQDQLWVGTETQGVLSVHLGKDSKITQHRVPSVSNNAINVLFADLQQRLWVGTNEGLYIFENGKFQLWQHDPSDSRSLSSNHIYAIRQDHSGNIWIGTAFGGINKFRLSKLQFHHHDYAEKTYTPDERYVYALAEDEGGTIWAGTFGRGLLKIPAESRANLGLLYREPLVLKGSIYAIYQRNDGWLWLGTLGDGLVAFNPRSRRISRYVADPNDPNSLSHNEVWCIAEDSSGQLWIGTADGLNRFDPTREKFTVYRHDPGNPSSLSFNNVQSLYRDSRGSMWVGTWGGGLNKIEGTYDSPSFRRFVYDQKNIRSLSSNVVMSILEDKPGRLWIGTWGGGINLLDEGDNSFKHYLEKDGLANNSVYGILKDRKGHLWISTNHGLSRLDLEKKTFDKFDVGDGLLSNEFNTASFLQARNGEMFFGGINGLISFFPEFITENTFIPPVRITSVKIRDQNIIANHGISLGHDQNFIRFDFAALDFSNSRMNEYAYRLEGLEKEWNYCGHQRYAIYTDLMPGQYVFRVIGSNDDGHWNQLGASFSFEIRPPLWGTWWFRSMSAAMIVGIAAASIWYRFRLLRRAKAVQEWFSKKLIESQEHERQRIAASLHDGHGQNLLIINNEMQRFIHQADETLPSRDDLKSWSALVVESINEVREIAYDLLPFQLNQLGLARSIESMIKKMQHVTAATFTTDLSELDVRKETEIHVYRIIQEALSNILKYAQATQVSVAAKRTGDLVSLTIRDNGRGFNIPQVRNGSFNGGFGLVSMAERARLVGGRLFICSRSGQGTEITLSIPVYNESQYKKI